MSTPQSDCPMAEVCTICGDIGRSDDILVCPRCKTNREHFYCRKIQSHNRTDDWCCDECEGKRMGSSKHLNGNLRKTLASDHPDFKNDQPEHSALRGKYRKAEKMVTKGKVKFIPSHEAMTLSSGGSGPKKVNTLVKTGKNIDLSSSRIERPMSPSPSIQRKGLSLKSPMTSVPLPLKRPANSVIHQQGSQKLHVPKEREAVQANRKEPMQMAESDTTMEPVETQVASLVKETSVPKEASSALAPDGHGVSDDIFLKISELEKRGPTDIELNAPNYSKVPARYSSWKGRFDIQGEDFNHTSSEYLAFTRARCKRKVFEFYKRMPELLKFKLIPRQGIWRDLFKDEFYGEDEIGLYFFSGGNKRFSGYDFFLEFIDDKDFAMRCDVGEVELYVFTSKLLPADYQRMYGGYYYWGVLRKVAKHNNVSRPLQGSPSSTTLGRIS